MSNNVTAKKKKNSFQSLLPVKTNPVVKLDGRMRWSLSNFQWRRIDRLETDSSVCNFKWLVDSPVGMLRWTNASFILTKSWYSLQLQQQQQPNLQSNFVVFLFTKKKERKNCVVLFCSCGRRCQPTSSKISNRLITFCLLLSLSLTLSKLRHSF